MKKKRGVLVITQLPDEIICIDGRVWLRAYYSRNRTLRITFLAAKDIRIQRIKSPGGVFPEEVPDGSDPDTQPV